VYIEGILSISMNFGSLMLIGKDKVPTVKVKSSSYKVLPTNDRYE